MKSWQPADWFGIGSDRQVQTGRLLRGLGSRFKNRCLPLTADYFHPMEASFSMDVRDRAELDSRGGWFFRDGRVPIREFFKRFSSPKGVSCILHIEARLACEIPKAWRSRVQLYELVQIEREVESLKNSLTYLGMMLPGDLIGRREFLKVIEKAPRDVPRFSCLWPFWSAGGAVQNASVPDKVKKFLRDHDRHAVTEIDPHRFLMLKNFTDDLFVFLNAGVHVADPMPLHYVLSRGGSVLGLRIVPRSEADVLLSPYHGFKFQKCIE